MNKFQLIKTDNSLILVSDEEIKEGELCYLIKANKCIIYSTKWQKEFSYNNSKKVLSQSPKLSKLSQEDKDEIGWTKNEWADYMIEKANYIRDNIGGGLKFNRIELKDELIEVFCEIADKAQELNQKKYTLNDMESCFAEGVNAGQMIKELPTPRTRFKDFIKPLSQPQQWACEAIEIDGVWNVTKIKH